MQWPGLNSVWLGSARLGRGPDSERMDNDPGRFLMHASRVSDSGLWGSRSGNGVRCSKHTIGRWEGRQDIGLYSARLRHMMVQQDEVETAGSCC